MPLGQDRAVLSQEGRSCFWLEVVEGVMGFEWDYPGVVGIAQLVARRTRDRKVTTEFGSRQERQENFLLQCKLSVLTPIRCPFHPRVIAVARKRPLSVCQTCRWQITPKHACTFDPTKSEWAYYATIQAY